MVITGYDDRHGCGYVVTTGPDMPRALPGTLPVAHDGVTVLATPELAATLRDALRHRPMTLLSWQGPEVPLTWTTARSWRGCGSRSAGCSR